MILTVNLIISSNNWIVLWVFNEVWTFLITLTLVKTLNNIVKFFCIQAFISMNVILTVIINNSWTVNYNLTVTLLIIIFLIKMNLFPFNLWIFSVQKSINWNVFVYINFIYKIPTFMLLKYTFNNINLLYFIICLSMIMFNINNMKIFLFNVSINNMFWILLTLKFNFNFWILIYSTYIMFNLILIVFLIKYNVLYFNNEQLINNKTKIQYYIMLFNLISVPFIIMFNIKWMLIKLIVHDLILFSFLIFNLINQILYIKFIMKRIIIQSLLNKWTVFFNSHNDIFIYIIMIYYFLI